MKNLKLTIFSAIFLAFSALTSCTKEGITVPVVVPVPPAPPAPPASTANAIYYVDSAKIYSTSSTGTNRRLVAGIDTLNPNSYIGSMVRSNDGNKLYFLHYISAGTPGGTPVIKLYGVNKDGTGLTMLKNMPNISLAYELLKATTDNKIVFYQNAFTPFTTVVKTLQIINADGTNQTALATLPAVNSYTFGLSSVINRYASIDFTGGATILQTGTISGNSIGAPVNIGTTNGINGSSLSNDGSKIAYLKVNAAGIVEIYVYDVATATSQLKFTHTVVAGISLISDYSVLLRWVAGTDKILLGYGKYAQPSGSASDFTQLTLYTLNNSTEVTWRYEGDRIFTIVTE